MKYDERVRLPLWLLVNLIALTPALFTGCARNAAQQGFDRPPAPVTVTAAIMQDVPIYLDAIGKTVWAVIACGSSTLVTPRPRVTAVPLSRIPSATP